MRKQLRRNRKKVLDTAAGLHELLVKDASWVQDLASLAAAPDLESRMLGLALLLEMKSPAAITSAQKCLRNRAWELRSLAFRYLAVNRDVTSIPLLISRWMIGWVALQRMWPVRWRALARRWCLPDELAQMPSERLL